MANHYTFGIGQPHTETDDELTPVGLSSDGTSLVSGDGRQLVPFGAAANTVFSSYGVSAAGGSWANTCGAAITVGTISLTHSLSNERPRFQTYTRKCVIGSTASEIRFNSANFTADQTEKAFSIDVYIESMPSEFLGASNPYIDVSIHNSTTFGSNYSRWSFNAGYIRQGWNTLKMRQADTVSATAGAGNLPIGCNHNADVGTGFDWTGTGQCLVLVFNNMNGQTVHIDELRRPAKAVPVVTIGFDASGFNATDEVFVTKVAPLFQQYGIRSYCTMTNIYELIYAGAQAWRRIANLYNTYGWDVINHTWSHGGTTVGRVVTLTSLTRTSNVCTGTVSGGHNLPVGYVIKGSIQGATGTPGTDMNTDATAAMPDITVTSSTAFTYASTGSNGTATGTPKLYTFLSEVISANNAENLRLLTHEVADVQKVLRANGFSRGAGWMALPNNSVPELSAFKTVCDACGVKFARAYRGGYTFVHELGVDNPLNMGSFVMDSGTNYTRLSEIQAKVAGAIARGEHIHIFGHYILDDTDPANAAYAPVDPDYPPGQGGNPAPPSASLSGFGGWWYYSQLRTLIQSTIAPALANGTLLAKSPAEYTGYMGEFA
jgi:DNA-binding phage protein